MTLLEQSSVCYNKVQLESTMRSIYTTRGNKCYNGFAFFYAKPFIIDQIKTYLKNIVKATMYVNFTNNYNEGFFFSDE